MALTSRCRACLQAASTQQLRTTTSLTSLRLSSSHSRQPPARTLSEDNDEEFQDVIGELHRRKKRIDEKRKLQGGGDFVDFLRVTVRGGKGGSGTSSFAPTKRGGLGPPNGGNGGPGGSVYLETSPFLTSLSTVNKRLVAGQGGHGAGNLRGGHRGEDVIVTVPLGTVIREIKREGEAEKTGADYDALDLPREERRQRTRDRWLAKHPNYEANPREIRDAETLLRKAGRWTSRTPGFDVVPALELDIAAPLAEPLLLSRGGVGGLGNTHFTTETVRHPRLASRGVLPVTRTFEFELKLLADVGLVGLPNAGKSTLLRALTGRRAEVADYAFTTLNPQIGVVRVLEDDSWAAASGPVPDTEDERAADVAARAAGDYQPLPRAPRIRKAKERTRFTISDNPGLLHRASENVGLGHSFLRSIERSLALAYVLDGRRPDPVDDLKVLRAELEAYKPGLSSRARIIALNKTDELEQADIGAKVAALEQAAVELDEGRPQVVVTSAKYGRGLDRVVSILADAVDAARPPEPKPIKVKHQVPLPFIPEEPVEAEEDLIEI